MSKNELDKKLKSREALERIRGKIGGGGDRYDQLVTSIHYVMKTYKLTVDQIQKMYISTFQTLVGEINKENEEKAKQSKKGQRGRKPRLKRR